jgi:hypothetical protein
MQIMDLIGEKKVFKKKSRPCVKRNRVVSMWNFEQPNYPIPITKKFLKRCARQQKKEFRTKKKFRRRKIGKIRKRLGPKKGKPKKKKFQFVRINIQIW